MNTLRQSNPLNPQIRNEATEWLLRFSEGEVDSTGREEFNYWLRTSPEHVRAYLRVAAFWQAAGHLDGKAGPRDIDALISQAKQEGNIFPLANINFIRGSHPNDRAASRHASLSAELPSAQRRYAARRFFAIAATLLVAIGAVGAHQYLTRNIYETNIGEQRTINLADGSTLILNADSRVRVRYSETERTIDLEEGQALFKVAKNPSRPFVVRSGEASVRAVGTQFDVYRKSTGTIVTVVEGKVASTTPSAPTPVFLIAGEQLTIPKITVAQAKIPAPGDTPTEPKVRLVKVEEATAWTEGILIFDGTSLTEVIREFNRQNSKPLVLQGAPELAQIKITGSFPANGSERITKFLQERFSVAAHETDDHIALTRQSQH